MVHRDPIHARRLWLYGYTALVLCFLVFPIVLVIPMSFTGGDFLEFPPSSWSLRWYRAYLTSDEWWEATIVSARAAVLTSLVAPPIGVLAAYALRVSRSPRSDLVRVTVLTPLIVPVIFIAIGVFFLYAKLKLLNTTLGLVLAHTVLAVPFVMLTVGARLERFDLAQEMVARSLGASRPVAFLQVTLPQIRTSVLVGALFAFITSFDEVVIGLFISNGPYQTLTKRMFASLRDQIDPTVAAISSLLIVLSIVVLGIAQLIGRERGPR